MRSLNLSGELVRICGLLRSTLCFGLDCKSLHTSKLKLVWCSSRRFDKFRCLSLHIQQLKPSLNLDLKSFPLI